jgi:hypothetical protein
MQRNLGSIKNKIVATDLQEERDKGNFNKEEMSEILYEDKAFLSLYRDWIRVMESDKVLTNTEKWYEMTREEKMVVNM